MEPLKTTSEDSTELASEQSPKTLSKEEIKRIIGNCQRVLDELSSTWLSQTKKQIKDVRFFDLPVMFLKLIVGPGRNSDQAT